MQLPLFDTPSTWRPPTTFPSWAGAKRVAIDVEARDEKIKQLGPGCGRRPNTYITAISIAIEDGPALVMPIRQQGGDNMDAENVLRYVRDEARAFTGDLAGANLPYDLDFLESDEITFPSVRYFRDVQIADPLIYELHDRYSLDAIAKRWGFPGKEESTLRAAAVNYGLKNPKSEMWKLPGRFLGEYGEADVRLPLAILRRQEREIEEQGLWNAYNLESELLPILTQMRRRGVRVHVERLNKIAAWAMAQEQECCAKVKHLVGFDLAIDGVNKPDVMEAVLLRVGVRVGKTKSGRPNVDKVVLGAIDHPVGEVLEWARKVNKLRGTFVQSVRDHMTPDGRIHCTYNQLRRQREEDTHDKLVGAAFGRLSCEHPNLEQQPARDEFAPMWRAIYLPEEGEQWAACDFSQQEPRMAVHYACLSKAQIGFDAWEKAIEARDKYRTDPKTDNHQMMADMAGIKRKVAKAIFLGLAYGMGGAKLCIELGLPTRFVVRSRGGILFDVESDEGKQLIRDGARRFEAAGPEGQALLDRFDAAVPFIRRLARACERKAYAAGFITLIDGRRVHFPKDRDGNYDWTYKAFNRLVQGSSAIQMKMAMIALHKAGYRILVPVHDENGISVPGETEARGAAQVMLNCFPLELPSKVDVEMGSSWGHSMLGGADEKVRELFTTVLGEELLAA